MIVNIQSNSKFHPPHQNFLDPLLNARSSFFLELPPLKYAGCTPRLQTAYDLQELW